MRVAILSSGEKDSPLHGGGLCNGWDIELVTVSITGNDSWMFQIPGTDMVEHQAKLAGLDWLRVERVKDYRRRDFRFRRVSWKLNIDGIVSEHYVPTIKNLE